MRKFLVFLFIVFSGITFAYASNLSVRQYPDNPREGEQVKLTLESDKYDLGAATITWTIDGQVADSGVGRRTLDMKTSQNGLGQVVVATVEQDGYNSDQIQKVVEANTNFILYEGADSYVPSFYKGRRLPAKEGTIRAGFFSFKDGSIQGLDGSSNANYTWKVNGDSQSSMSGVNKVVNNINTKVTDTNIQIEVTKEDQTQTRKTTDITVPLQSTQVVIYKTDEKKLLRQLLSDTETAKKIYLLVEPFFFSVNNKSDSRLGYTWKINDVESKTATPWSVVFSGKSSDTVKINLDIFNNQKITQENSRGFTFKIE
jgi:hypothetical protein